MGIGDWGLGPIPNPQSPIPNLYKYKRINRKYINQLTYIKYYNLINYNTKK